MPVECHLCDNRWYTSQIRLVLALAARRGLLVQEDNVRMNELTMVEDSVSIEGGGTILPAY